MELNVKRAREFHTSNHTAGKRQDCTEFWTEKYNTRMEMGTLVEGINP
jgi:hypothetical protein